MFTTKQSAGNGADHSHHWHDAADTLRQRGADATANAREGSYNVLEHGKESAVSATESSARAMHSAAQSLSSQGQDTLAGAALTLAKQLGKLSSQLESNDVRQLPRQAKRVATARPTLYILGGVALGLAAKYWWDHRTPADAAAQPSDSPIDDGPSLSEEPTDAFDPNERRRPEAGAP